MEADRVSRKQNRIGYMRAAAALALLVLLLTVATSMIPVILSPNCRFDRSLIRACGDPDAEAPEISAKCAIMYSLDLDRTVYEKDADRRMPPYSMTKILTCYLALENLDPDQVVTISENATRELEDGVKMELEPGEKISAGDLVFASMMMSANDAATALAEAVSGSEEKFIKLMNDTVMDWGCNDTHFVNANGWDNRDHYTTARDMAVIVKHCLANDRLREISLTEEYTVPATNKNDELHLDNALLKTLNGDPAVTGGKTGSWSEDQCTISLEFTDNALSAVIVLLGDTVRGRSKDPRVLINWAHDVTPGFIVTDSDKGAAEAWVKHGAVTKVPLDVKGLRYAYPANRKASGIEIRTETEKLEAPVRKGDKAGTYRIYANGKEVGKGVLYAGEDVERGWFTSALYISDRIAFLSFLFAALILLLGFVLEKNRKTGK